MKYTVTVHFKGIDGDNVAQAESNMRQQLENAGFRNFDLIALAEISKNADIPVSQELRDFLRREINENMDDFDGGQTVLDYCLMTAKARKDTSMIQELEHLISLVGWETPAMVFATKLRSPREIWPDAYKGEQK